ncbi:MAG: M14 family metallopeptidase [Gammaproteobacteria bacterium]|nr:M14 family metallopeptidase [Gammaproteobacteria bacterium]
MNAIPEGLLELPAGRLHERLDGPTLIHLPGRQPRPLFVSVLLHGNEDTGWEAMRLLLQNYAHRTLPRALSLFIGNIEAAREGVRHLEGKPDYNRIWKGGESEEAKMAQALVGKMRERNVFASIDIHNNTGLNPHYACINLLQQPFLQLATLFSRTIVYFIRPDSVQSMAFSKLCPAVTVECGKAGLSHNTEHAMTFVEGALHLDHFPEHAVPDTDYELYHTVVTVKVPQTMRYSFSDPSADLVFPGDLDHMNFRELPAGTELARIGGGARLEAWDERGEDVAERYFDLENGRLTTRLPVMPSMLTLNEEVIRQDCLCYLMERLPPIS